MKQIVEGWTIAVKVDEMYKTSTYFMGIRTSNSDNKYVTLETYPTDTSVLKNLFGTQEDAMNFWTDGMWDLSINRKLISVLPVKIKIEIDISTLGLDWNGIYISNATNKQRSLKC